MQRSICRFVGACGLIFTFTASGQTAASSGASATGTGSTTASGQRTTVPQPSTSARPGVGVTSRPPQTAATANHSGAAGQPTTTTATSPNTVQTALPGQSPTATATTAAGTSAPPAPIVTGTSPITTTRSAVSFSSLPAAVQSSIAAQIPAGAQIGNVIQETTPLGTTFRAQVLQNGIPTEVTLSGVPGIASSFAGVRTTTTGGLVPTTAGVIAGTPFLFEQLPAGVQTALAAQAGGASVTNITFTPGPSGTGTFRGFANGESIEVRTAATGQITPTTRLATTATNEFRVEDLPVSVRDAVKQRMPFAEITRIRKSDSASGSLFDLTLRTDNGMATMQVSENGTIVRENRNLALEITTPPVPATNEAPKLNYTTLPLAVRETIEAQTDPKSVRTLVLTNLNERAAYAVDYVDKDGFRNRLYIGKDGLIARTLTNIHGIAHTGRAITIDDLPSSAKRAIEDQAASSAITRIDLDTRGLTPVYIVSYLNNGETRQMVVTREGVRMDAVGAPPSATTGEEPVSVKGLPEAEEQQKRQEEPK